MHINMFLIININRMEVLKCGFCGYIDKQNITNDKNIFTMSNTLKGVENTKKRIHIQNPFAIGYSYVDSDYDSYITRVIKGITYSIAFNGKLYNLEYIKETLLKKDYYFLTEGDAEAVLLSYIEYKEKCLDFLDGGFSFIIYSENKLFLARDRLGLKPLYYYQNGPFVFSSEIKAMLTYPSINAKVGKNELCEILGLGPAHTPGKTFFKDIFEILPGRYAIVQEGTLESFRYWDLETKDNNDSLEENISKVKELVITSLNKQLVSKKPICSMLSGGLDSSILAYLASKKIDALHTFSIDFEENKDNFVGNSYQPTRDSDYVKIMKEYINSNHTELYFSTEEIINSLEQSVVARDMPGMADVDSSMLVFCKKIKEKGFDIAISGECSDEIFGGYPWYYKENLINSINFPWSRALITRKNIINTNLVNSEHLLTYIDKAFKQTTSNVVFNSTNENENTFRKNCYNTVKWFMNTLIERTDRMSLLSGLEVRIPFADYRIFEYVYNLSAKKKLGLIQGNNNPVEKYILRKAFEDNLPDNVVYRKKSPFPKTYDPKYTEILEQKIKDIINKSTSPLLQIVNVRYLYELLETHGTNLKENWFGQLMTYPQTLAYLIQINFWLDEYNVEIDI